MGRNLQNHACYRLQYLCNAPVSASRHLRPHSAAAAALRYALFRSGPLAETYAVAGGYFRTDPGLEVPDAQVVLLSALGPATAGGATFRIRDLLPDRHGFGLTVYQGSPLSRGAVSLRSADPLDRPRIEAGYFSDPRDMGVLLKAVKRMRGMMRRPAIAKHIDRELLPGESGVGRPEPEGGHPPERRDGLPPVRDLRDGVEGRFRGGQRAPGAGRRGSADCGRLDRPAHSECCAPRACTHDRRKGRCAHQGGNAVMNEAMEPALEPELRIVDAHHHLMDGPGHSYGIDDYAADCAAGHDIRASVYIEVRQHYLDGGPEHLRPVGETEFVASLAARAEQGAWGGRRLCAGIVGYADLAIGDHVGEVLDAHIEAGGGRFKGIRRGVYWDSR